MKKVKKKLLRYSNLINKITNWKSYLWFKFLSTKKVFDFELRNSFSISVPRHMLSSFKECFFDEVYFRNFPEEFLNKDNMTVIDIGANAGYFSLFAQSKLKNPKIYAFEPMPYAYKFLEKYKDTYPDMDLHIHQKALSNKNGTLILNTETIDNYSTKASIFSTDEQTLQIEVEAITLQSFMQEQGIENIDLMKLDCEGSEYPILYTMPNEILNRISLLCIETHKGIGERENTESLVKHLHSHNFEITSLSEGTTGYIWAWKKK